MAGKELCDCTEEIVCSQRKGIRTKKSNPKFFQHLLDCLDNGKHRNMLQYVPNTNNEQFEVTYIDKKNKKLWNVDAISLFLEMDEYLNKKLNRTRCSSKREEEVKVRFRSNISKCFNNYLEKISSKKEKCKIVVKYKILRRPEPFDGKTKSYKKTKGQKMATTGDIKLQEMEYLDATMGKYGNQNIIKTATTGNIEFQEMKYLDATMGKCGNQNLIEVRNIRTATKEDTKAVPHVIFGNAEPNTNSKERENNSMPICPLEELISTHFESVSLKGNSEIMNFENVPVGSNNEIMNFENVEIMNLENVEITNFENVETTNFENVPMEGNKIGTDDFEMKNDVHYSCLSPNQKWCDSLNCEDIADILADWQPNMVKYEFEYNGNSDPLLSSVQVEFDESSNTASSLASFDDWSCSFQGLG